MKLLVASTKNELEKLFSRKKYLVFIIIECIICILGALISVLIKNASIKAGFFINIKITNYAMFILPSFLSLLIPLYLFMAATDLFATEVSNISLRATLIRPISRLKIFCSKIAAVLVCVVVNLLVIFIVSTAMEAIFTGIDNPYRMMAALASYLIDIIPILVLILMAVLVNQLVKGPSMAMFLSIIIFAVLSLADRYAQGISGSIFTSYMTWHNIWIGSPIPFTAMLTKIMLIAGYGIVFFCVGFYLFDKKEM